MRILDATTRLHGIIRWTNNIYEWKDKSNEEVTDVNIIVPPSQQLLIVHLYVLVLCKKVVSSWNLPIIWLIR